MIWCLRMSSADWSNHTFLRSKAAEKSYKHDMTSHVLAILPFQASLLLLGRRTLLKNTKHKRKTRVPIINNCDWRQALVDADLSRNESNSHVSCADGLERDSRRARKTALVFSQWHRASNKNINQTSKSSNLRCLYRHHPTPHTQHIIGEATPRSPRWQALHRWNLPCCTHQVVRKLRIQLWKNTTYSKL